MKCAVPLVPPQADTTVVRTIFSIHNHLLEVVFLWQKRYNGMRKSKILISNVKSNPKSKCQNVLDFRL